MQISHLADTMCHDLPSGLKVCPNHIGLAPCTQVKAQVMRRSPTLQVPSPKKLTATWSASSSPSTSCHCAAPNHITANRAVLALLTSSQQDQTHAPGKQRHSQLKPVSQPWQGMRTFLYLIWNAAPRPIGIPSPMKANPPSCKSPKFQSKALSCNGIVEGTVISHSCGARVVS